MVIELRIRLWFDRLTLDKFLNNIFKNFEDYISVNQLTRKFAEDPLNLPIDKGQQYARYIIESRDNPEIELIFERTKEIPLVKSNIYDSLDISYQFSSVSDLDANIKQTIIKLKSKTAEIENALEGSTDAKNWASNLKFRSLNPMEIDIVLLIGFETNKDIMNLSSEVTDRIIIRIY